MKETTNGKLNLQASVLNVEISDDDESDKTNHSTNNLIKYTITRGFLRHSFI